MSDDKIKADQGLKIKQILPKPVGGGHFELQLGTLYAISVNFPCSHCAPLEVSTHVRVFALFWLIIAFVTRADTLSILVQIGSGGKWCF